ncbi:hypothetical protein D3C72_1575350 [compost metagenome]
MLPQELGRQVVFRDDGVELHHPVLGVQIGFQPGYGRLLAHAHGIEPLLIDAGREAPVLVGQFGAHALVDQRLPLRGGIAAQRIQYQHLPWRKARCAELRQVLRMDGCVAA